MNTESRFVSFEECPQCHVTGGKKVFARYDDGHAFCFWCGHVEGRDKVPLVKSNEHKLLIALPHDCRDDLPVIAMHWLAQYEITRQEIKDNHIQWSEVRQQLVFPYKTDDKQLVGWQGRDFSVNAKSKWYSQGNMQDILHIIGDDWTQPLVIVEDIVSAIKVGRHQVCMPVFGTNVTAETITRLSNYFTEFRFWFDKDAGAKALKAQRTGHGLGQISRVIISGKDPKEHTDAEIKGYLLNA